MAQGRQQQSLHWLLARMDEWRLQRLADQGSVRPHLGPGGAVPASQRAPFPVHWAPAGAGEWTPDATALPQRLGLPAVGVHLCAAAKLRATVPDLPAQYEPP